MHPKHLTKMAEHGESKFFIFNGVLNGCYTSGMAMAIAGSVTEAIDKIVGQFTRDEALSLERSEIMGPFGPFSEHNDPIPYETRKIRADTCQRRKCHSGTWRYGDSFACDRNNPNKRDCESSKKFEDSEPPYSEDVDVSDLLFDHEVTEEQLSVIKLQRQQLRTEMEKRIEAFRRELENCKFIDILPIRSDFAFYMGGGD